MGSVMQIGAAALARRPFSVVVGIDFTDAGARAFEEAARITRRIPRCELHVVHVPSEATSEARARELAGQVRLYTQEKFLALGWTPGEADGGQVVGIHVRPGDAALELAQLANEIRADLIVIGKSRGPRLRRLVAGAIARRLVGLSSCPVIVAPAKLGIGDQDHEPTIDPPCPMCVEVRFDSHGDEWWCLEHGGAGDAARHSYHEMLAAPHHAALAPMAAGTAR